MTRLDPFVRDTPGDASASRSGLVAAMSHVVRFLHPSHARADDEAAMPMRIDATDLRALADALPISLLFLDDQGRVAVASASAERLLGYRRDGLADLSIDELMPTWEQGGQTLAMRADGRTMNLDVETRTLRLSGCDVALLILAPPTERPRHAREAARQRDELAHVTRVAMLGELSGALAHELNQPLSSILTNAQVAQRLLRARGKEGADPVLDEILADIVADDRRAGEVIQRLRKWLRNEHSEFTSLEVNELVLDALHLVRGELLHRGVDMHLELEGEMPAIDGDRILLQQVLLNFIMNGCDAMKGLPLPRVLRVRAFASNGHMLRVEVRDCGCGIAPAMLPVMFDPFETTKPDGMGMGLAVCRGIIETHGGRVFARNQPEGGACVGFELPARPS